MERLRESVNAVRDRIADSGSSGEKARLDKLKHELSKYNEIQDYFDEKVEDYSKQANKESACTEEKINELPKALENNPPVEIPNSLESIATNVTLDDIKNLLKTSFEIGLAFTPGETAFDVANFVSAMAFDQTLLNDDVDNLDKVLLFGATIIPFCDVLLYLELSFV